MSTLIWDQPGTRFYESGIDRGVLYLPEGNGVAWSGLIAVNEKVVGNEATPLYFDGVKFADVLVPGDYAASISAFTYPDEFLQFEGTVEVANGLFVTNQPQNRFGLSYRTMVDDDEYGNEQAYKIHVLYNLIAVPSQKNHQTLSANPNAIAFEWSITAIPGEIPGFRPTAHLIFDTRAMSPLLLADIENTLYGDGLTVPTLPDISTMVSFIGGWVIIRITDNGDGTWTAEGPDELITMLDATTFQITQANAVYLGVDKYAISSLTY